MNIESKIWKFSNTGMKMHCFDNGKALCNSNIRRFASDAGVDYSEAQVNYNLCARCETKFNAAIEATELVEVVTEVTTVQDEVVIKLSPVIEDDMRDVAARIRDRKARLTAYENAAKRLIEPTPKTLDFELDPMTGLPIVTVGDGRYVVGLVQGKAGVPYSPRFVRFWLVDGHRYYEAFEDSSRESIQGMVWAAQAELRNL